MQPKLRRKYGWDRYARRIVRQVWTHPNNRGQRVQALARAAGWQLYKRAVGRPHDVEVFGGAKLRCYPDSNYASKVFYFGAWIDYHEMRFAWRYLRPGDGFVDGGANIGMYTLLAAHLVGEGGTVAAFEPADLARSRLEENIALNGFGNVVVHAEALSDRSGTSAFIADLDVSNRLEQKDVPGAHKVDVRTTTLDAALGDRPFAMGKLDLEGAEMQALRGMEARVAAANPPVWQVETIDHLLRKQGSSRAEVVRWFQDHAFDVAVYDADTGRLEYLDRVDASHGNVLAVARSAKDAVHERLSATGRNATSNGSEPADPFPHLMLPLRSP